MISLPDKKTIVLASTSPRRKQLLAMLNIPFQVISSDVDESFDPLLSPNQIVIELASRKALAGAKKWMSPDCENKKAMVIGADTIVVWQNEIFGKPVDKMDAIRMLTQLQGSKHEVYTGVAVVNTDNFECTSTYKCTEVTFKSLNIDQITRYVESGEPLDKAGSYAIQGLGSVFVESIHGCYYNVVGLPVSILDSLLNE
jgi:septum formation protein